MAKPITAVWIVSILALSIWSAAPLQAQASATLSGTITAAGAPVANAKVSAKNTATNQTAETQTDSAGLYTIANLAPGDYAIAVTADGFSDQSANVTLAAGTQHKTDLTLAAAGAP